MTPTYITVPFNPLERMTIEKAAYYAGMSFEDYIRVNILSTAIADNNPKNGGTIFNQTKIRQEAR